MLSRPRSASVTLFLVLLVLAPMVVFVPLLAKTKRQGLMVYGGLASNYVQAFDEKWAQGEKQTDEPFLGSSDIQSLADLGNSFEVIRTMRLFPFSKQTALQITLVSLLPLSPLLLTMISLEELLQRVLGILL